LSNRALDSLRLEKSYGIWNAEFTQGYTPEMSCLKNFIVMIMATSSVYGHYVKQSLALAYVDKEFVNSDLTVDVIGEARKAITLKEPAYDPTGSRMRI
jgi:dimethylglycine dehydrogenase